MSTRRGVPVATLLSALLAAVQSTAATPRRKRGVAQPEVQYAEPKAAPFDNSPEAKAARAARREARLLVLQPLGMSNANYVMKPDVENILVVAERVGSGSGTKAEKKALFDKDNGLVSRIERGSIKLTAGAKAVAGVKTLAFVEQLKALAQVA